MRRAATVTPRNVVGAVPERTRLRAFPDAPALPTVKCPEAVWTVTTDGELPDEHERRVHDASAQAWDDYLGRILELEVHGYETHSEEAVAYGRRWECELRRGRERISVAIERTG